MNPQRCALLPVWIILLALFNLFGEPLLIARTGTPDPSFNPGTGPNGIVYSVAVQPDGKILLGGTFTSISGTALHCIARLNADGSVDSNFNPGTGPNGIVYSLVVQPDGKILIGGAFQTVNGTTMNGVARLNADGTVDTNFHSGTGVFGTVRSIALQADGHILIGGGFIEYNFYYNMTRLYGDGSLDGGFNPGTDINGAVYSMVLQPDRKILIGGDFTTVPGESRSRIARLNSGGSGDDTFDSGAGTSSTVRTLGLQADGKILLGGPLVDAVDHVIVDRVARLNADGSVDESFSPGTIQNYNVFSLLCQTDGKTLLGGYFLGVNGSGYCLSMRLNSNGSIDSGFNPGSSPNVDGVFAMAQQADGKIIIGGTFTSINGVSRNNIARLLNDPVTQTLLTPDSSQVLWLRSGAAPEVVRVTFELSTTGGAHWSSLGNGSRITGGWQITGLTLPDQGLIRVRGWTANGGIIEQVQAILPYETVPAIKGQQVPGQPPGTTFTAFTVPETGPFIGTEMLGRSKTTALFAANGSLLIAVSGTIPSLGTVASKLSGPSGDAAVVSLKSGIGGITSANSTVLLTGLLTSNLKVAAQTGTPTPGLPAGVTIKNFLAFDGNGPTPFFLANLQGTGVTSQNNVALCAALDSGTLNLLARKGDIVNGQKISTVGAFLSSAGTAADGRWRADDRDFGVRLSFADKSQAVCLISATSAGPGDWGVLSETGTISTIAPLNGMVATGFGLPSFGQGAASALVQLAAGKGGATSANNLALVTVTGSGSLVLAQKGGNVPDANGTPIPGAIFKSFADPVQGATNAVAFSATLSGTGISNKNNTGIWFSADGNTPRLLARLGDAAPGGGHWASFKSMVLPHNSAGGPIFLATLQSSSADGVSSKYNMGLWGVGSDGTLQLLLRTGQVAYLNSATTTVKSFTALVPVTGAIGTASGYDNNGHVAALITFANNTQALVQISIP